MLNLTNIVKEYVTGDTTVRALDNVSISFRKNEFVSILGHSGCGKTTMLNLIGGLDRYTSGNMFIKGVSTEQYNASDWDAYRNHSVGFVFQSYNLIPHQTVLANVELALTLSGVSKSERRKRAAEVLTRVGLADQLHKKPSQMSGGQMQRVAIARALVNDPEILLADEPTGALDTDTSVQIMEILREISKDKLIIMVTHNPELAEQYSDRIVRLKDGAIIGDTNPFSAEDEAKEVAEIYHSEAQQSLSGNENEIATKKKKKPSMSFFTALSLSFNNLLTKKTRTFLTSFAGSIGIIGIALILSLSNGINAYIDRVQRETLSSYPITIQQEEVDMTAMLATLMSQGTSNNTPKEENRVYTNPVSYTLLESMLNPHTKVNNLKKFKEYVQNDQSMLEYAELIRYGYNVDINAYLLDKTNKYTKADITALFEGMASQMMGGSSSSMSSLMTDSAMLGSNIWEELLPAENGSNDLFHSMIKEQYQLVAGTWPQSKNDVLLVISADNTISDLSLYALGLTSIEEMLKTMTDVQAGISVDVSSMPSYSFDQLIYTSVGPDGQPDKEYISYRIIPTSDYYVQVGGKWVDIRTLSESEQNSKLNSIVSLGEELRISGIIRPDPEATAASLTGTLVYTSALTEHLMNKTINSAVVKAQLADPSIDVITGLPFTKPNVQGSAQLFKEYLGIGTDKQLSNERLAEIYKAILSGKYNEAEYNKTVANTTKMFLIGMGVNEPPTDPALVASYKTELVNKVIGLAAGMGGYMNEADMKNFLDILSAEQLYYYLYSSVEAQVIANLENDAEEKLASIINTPDAVELDAAATLYAFELIYKTHPESLVSMYTVLMGLPEGSAAGMTPKLVYDSVVTAMQLYAQGSVNENYSAKIISAIGMADADGALMRACLRYRYSVVTAMTQDQINAFVSSLPTSGAGSLYSTFKNEINAAAIAVYAQSGTLTQSEAKKNTKLSAAFISNVESVYTDNQLKEFYNSELIVPKVSTNKNIETTLKLLGYVTEDSPSYISIYPKSFEDKERIADLIEAYNLAQTDDDDKISYSDYVGLIMSSVTTIVNAITYVLVFFVSISLVVSSIMIGIITYISVLERTKEIGILRAIGASKRDISRVFNAETLIVGFCSGMIGIIVTIILNIPISIIIKMLAGISGLSTLPVMGGIILVVISMLLTFIAGLIPSGIAAKKDPVESLRSE